MALSDCEKCWETPCVCGYDYRKWNTDDIKKLIEVLHRVLSSRNTEESWNKCKHNMIRLENSTHNILDRCELCGFEVNQRF